MTIRITRFIILCLLLAALLPVAAPARAAESAPVRIMPLGDSITYPNDKVGTYRFWLWYNLADLHYSVNFVGTVTGQYVYPPRAPAFDQDSEGHSGWSSQMLWQRISNDIIWTSTNIPDVVLMHIGTAGLCGGETPQTIIDNESLIIDFLRVKNPQVDYLVAQIIPADPNQSEYPDCNGRLNQTSIQTLNSLIVPMAAAKNTTASRVIAVDMYTGYDEVLDNISDHVHPNESGEKKIAGRWTVALIDLLGGYGNRVYLPYTAR